MKNAKALLLVSLLSLSGAVLAGSDCCGVCPDGAKSVCNTDADCATTRKKTDYDKFAQNDADETVKELSGVADTEEVEA